MTWSHDLALVLEVGKALAHSELTISKLDLAEKLLAVSARIPEIQAWPETKALVASAVAYAKLVGGQVETNPDTGAIAGYSIPPNGAYPGARGGSMYQGEAVTK